MGVVYKIHPAIGIARVGNHKDAFFIGPELLGSPGVEIGPKGREMQVLHYKKDGLTKRQAARFRVFSFEQDDRGGLKLIGEVTADDARIEWKVDLCNRKAALARAIDGHPALPRNTGIADRDSLVIRNPKPVTISGKNLRTREFNGRFLGKKVYLGELRTDAKGRLLVLGGRGQSGSVPDGARLGDWANNDKWYDDVSDGPVSAVITFPGENPIAVHHASWVVIAPPDFAPSIASIVTLYDIAFQAAIEKGALKPDDVPSFRRHIRPLIERAAALRWVNNFSRWSELALLDWNELASTATRYADLRGRVAQRLQNPGLTGFNMPNFMKVYLDQWAKGNFISDLKGKGGGDVSLPEQIDRAALDACVGNNFFPGIEASLNLRDKDIYARPFRLDHTNLGKVYPGCLTEIMALPWQADFFACDDRVWWPSQRPDIAMTDANRIPTSEANWVAPVGGYKEMVEHVLHLGFVVPVKAGKETVFVEQERNEDFPREALVAIAGGKRGKKGGRRSRVA